MWVIRDGVLTNSEFTTCQSHYYIPPYPDGVWTFSNGQLSKAQGMIQNEYGACCHVYTLNKVRFPKTVRKIGDYAFYNTALTQVKIPNNCTIGAKSFPPNCEIIRYS